MAQEEKGPYADLNCTDQRRNRKTQKGDFLSGYILPTSLVPECILEVVAS